MQPFLIGDGWIEVRDGDATCRAIFDQHYSRYIYADGRKPKLFVGPGQKMVLLRADARALFVWRKFKSMDKQVGVNCCIFRNVGSEKASELILEAEELAWLRWPRERLYTYVNPAKVKGNPPGNCFRHAGWTPVGVTKRRRLLILEKAAS